MVFHSFAARYRAAAQHCATLLPPETAAAAGAPPTAAHFRHEFKLMRRRTAPRQLLLDPEFLAFHVGNRHIIGKRTLGFLDDGGVKRSVLGFQRLDPVLKAHYYPPWDMGEVDSIGRRKAAVSEKIALCARLLL
ncbi:hypothetical protein MTBLM5_100046 [Magnetospirillum sp. LM-5]|nr:hypothetical protein MTBLM5_100046 [Magnetospirillum sp. LM-5]